MIELTDDPVAGKRISSKEEQAQRSLISDLDLLGKKLDSKNFRHAYVVSHIKRFLSAQIRNFRGEKTQKEFSKELGVTQSMISRYEDPEYGKLTIQTLFDIAEKLDVALVIRFSTYFDFFRITSDFSNKVYRPTSYSPKEIVELRQKLENEVCQKLQNGIAITGIVGESGDDSASSSERPISAGGPYLYYKADKVHSKEFSHV